MMLYSCKHHDIVFPFFSSTVLDFPTDRGQSTYKIFACQTFIYSIVKLSIVRPSLADHLKDISLSDFPWQTT